VLAGIFGGIVGAKIPIWLMHFDLIASDPALLLPGRTIVGGIIGGTISVYAAKKILRIRGKKGNMFAPAIALGVAIGRIGCFLTGCCYGKHTTLPWGVDFGDGPRHPTQLYEAGFMLIVFFYLLSIRKNAKPGFLYMMFVNLYFSFRFIEEFINEGDLFLGLNIFQYLSLAAIFVMNIKYIIDRRKPYANEE